MLLSGPDEITHLRIRLAEQEREMAALREAASDAAEAAAARLRAARQDTAALQRALDEAQAGIARPAEAEPDWPAAAPLEVQEAHSVPLPAVALQPAPRRGLGRAAVRPIWRLIRPIARPVLWRARSFLMADTVRELTGLRDSYQQMQQSMDDAVREAAAEETRPVPVPAPMPVAAWAPHRAAYDVPGHGLGLGDTAAERWLLTVALEGAQMGDSLEGAPESDSRSAQPA